jgi:CubicO group peptidase (beta-lactamase class C family)
MHISNEHSRKTHFLRTIFHAAAFVILALTIHSPAPAQTPSPLSEETRGQIDQAARQVLESTGVPSASVAVVKDGSLVYTHACGNARLEPPTPATAEMRYKIGSISKQFTATAILMLAEQGKLSLDDPVSRFLPDLTRANEVTIRQLLSHTSGYQDYWPQDYVPPFMLTTITADQILTLWARKPLDFDPGTKWQYSNTNYVIAGVIVEKASGMPLLRFLSSHIFEPLGMQSVVNIDQDHLADTDPTGYMRYALGPLRAAPREGKGWLFAAGELAMPVADLAKWDIAMMNQRLLKPSSYQEMQRDVLLNNGAPTGYGLGISVRSQAGRRMLEHSGEVSGFTAENVLFPEDRAAVIVLTNQDAVNAGAQIARKIAPLLFAANTAVIAEKVERARKILEQLQQGKIDRSLFTDNANSYFDQQALQDFAASLGPLGKSQDFQQTSEQLRGGMTYRAYRAKCGEKVLSISTFEMPDGKIEQYLVSVGN